MRRALVWASSVLLAMHALAAPARITLGPTWPIAEPDAREELRARAAAVDWRAALRPDSARASAFDSADLPRATRSAVRLFDPTYTLPQDVRDASGRVLFARGTRVNVYERIRMPGRLIVVGPRPAEQRWLQQVAKPTPRDKVLLATGNVLHARTHTHTKKYRLDARAIQRFGLRATPSIVEQVGTHLRITEHALP